MGNKQWVHITLRVFPGTPDLTREDTGGWLWPRLREIYPDALSGMLMPNHSHLVNPTEDPARDERRLMRLFGQFGRVFRVGGRVGKLGDRGVLEPGQKLSRMVRYIALNPCRRRLTECPLAWRWSTHRDVVGATADPWVTAERLARALDNPLTDFAARHHAYVSADPSACVTGTPLPIAMRSASVSTFPLTTIIDAAVSALRVPRSAIRSRGPARALFVALAIDQGWTRTTQLAEACDCGEDAIRRHASNVDAAALSAARLCLGDARLLR